MDRDEVEYPREVIKKRQVRGISLDLDLIKSGEAGDFHGQMR